MATAAMASPMTSYIQILGGGTKDGGNGIMLFFDNARYLFNCGEGTQRLATQHQIKLAGSKLQALFLTNLSWKMVGGLPGMICTIADSAFSGAGGKDDAKRLEETDGISKVQIVGPSGTGHFLASLRPFLRRSQMELHLREIHQGRELIYEDELISVTAMKLLKDNHHSSADSAMKKRKSYTEEDAITAQSPPVTSVKEVLLNMFKNDSFTSSAACSPHSRERGNERLITDDIEKDMRLVYRVAGPSQPGRFDAAKAKALGVPFGPLNGKLMKGESIALDDGTVINPSDCITPPSPGFVFYVIDATESCFGEDRMSFFDQIKAVYAQETSPSQVRLVLIYLDGASLDSDDYEAQLKNIFNCPVVTIDHQSQYPIYHSFHNLMGPLTVSIPDFFTVPEGSTQRSPYSQRSPCIPLAKYPWYKKDFSGPMPAPETALYHSTHKVVYSPMPDNPHVTFLGTGAALPGKYRNVSGILLDYGDAAYILDCGEATLGQLYRRFGTGGAATILSRLQGIIISHLHADHQLGTISVLNEISQLKSHGVIKDPGHTTTVVAPHRYKQFLEEYGECSTLPSDYNFIASEDILRKPTSVGVDSIEVMTENVIHCPHAFGIIVKHRHSEIQVAYSGDTRPCPAFAATAKGSHILIHEATFSDTLPDEALDKRHSTISEAISIGVAMSAEFTLLTHISQRYAKSLPPHENWQQYDNVLPVFDLMTVNLNTLREHKPLHQIITMMSELLPSEETAEDVTDVDPQA